MSVPMIDPTLNPAMNNNTLNNAVNTLQGLNQARKQFLDNQALQATVPYAGPQAAAGLGQTQAQTGLIQAQTAAVPYTSVGALLSGVGRAIPALSPFGYLRNAPEQVKEVAAANQILGQQNVGNVPIPNYSGLLGGVGGLIGRVLGGQGIGGGNAAPSAASALAGDAQAIPSSGGMDASSQPQPLALSPQQISNLQNVMHANGISTNSSFGSGSNQQAQQLAANLMQQAQNRVASPALIQKYNYAQNLAKTINTTESNFGIPAINFAPYMGVGGQLRLKKDLASLANGKPNERAEQYVAFEKTIPILSEQLTQFYGGSIAPAAQEQLETLQNPAIWINSPGAAIRAYNNLKEIISTEGQTSAQTVGKSADYAQLAPKFDPQKTYSELTKNSKYAADVIRALPPSQRAQLRAYHDSLKGNPNG